MKALQTKLNDACKALTLSCHISAHLDSLWCELSDKELLVQLAELLQGMNARVCMVTAYVHEKGHNIVYHFDVNGVMLNITLFVDDKSVPSITPFFKSADWTERELSELYGIALENHPNPKRLFIDDAIKEEVLKEYYTLSSMMSGKINETLWSRIKAQKEVIYG